MKKMFTILLAMLLCTNICFAAPISSVSQSKLDQLERISNDLKITIDKINSNRYDKSILLKDLTYIKSSVRSIINTTSANYSDLDEQALNDFMLTVAASYNLTVNGLQAYLSNDNLKTDYFINALFQYKLGNIALSEIKASIK